MVGGKVIRLSENGFTLNVSHNSEPGVEENRHQNHGTTEITFQGVDRMVPSRTEGYYARVWLQEGTNGYRAKVLMIAAVAHDLGR